MNQNADTIRRRVAEEYARAVARTRTDDGVCCPAPDASSSTATTQCCAAREPGGVAAKVAGYDRAELETLPMDAVASAFGCGDPVAFAGVEPGQVVVDLGSGAGIDLLLAAKKVGPEGRVIGIDMTDDMIERAERNIRDAGLENVEVRKGLIEALPIEDASVDWVISNCVINLSPEKDRVFAEIARVLRPGGRVMVSDIVAADLPGWIRDDAGLYCGCIAGAIDEASYLRGMRDAGLTDVTAADRYVYGDEQLDAFVASEMSADACGCTAGDWTPERAREIAGELKGKVWSVHVTARKA